MIFRILVTSLFLFLYCGAFGKDSLYADFMSIPKQGEPTPKTIYLFSGLGADYRVFKHLQLPGYRLVFIEWIPPEHKETMSHYASRIKSQITAANPILIGVSFGGMISVEVSKLMPVNNVILISSAKTKYDLEAGANFFLRYRLYNLVPGSLLKKTNFFVDNLFGVKTRQDKDLLAEILADTDVTFFRWAMTNILTWQNDTYPEQLIHIHGTSDKIIPYENIKADYTIKDGGHFMVLNRAAEIQEIILKYLKEQT